MKKTITLSLVIAIALSFLSLLVTEQGVHAGPGPVQTKSQTMPVEQIQKSKAAGGLPDLLVESIWLDNQCNVNFKLRNSGPGNIPEGEYKDSAVRVQYGSDIKDFPLSRIDASGVLKKAGGVVSFNTQIPLKSSADVKVTADFSKKIREPDAGEKNNEKTAKLTPQCPAAQMKADVKTKTTVGTTAGVQKSTGQKVPSIPIGIKADTAPINITILSPALSSSWDVGSTLKVQWKVMAPPGVFHLLLKTPGMADGQSTAQIVAYQKMQPEPQGFFNWDWQIPSYIKPGDYIVEIHYWSDTDQTKVFSKSGVFKINQDPMAVVTGAYAKLPSPVINVVNPAQNSTWTWEESHKIQWKSSPYGLGKLDIALFTEKGALAQQVGSSPDSGTYDWKVPSNIPTGKYFIRISTSDNKISGDSKVFNISGLMTQVFTKALKQPPAPVKITSFKLVGFNPNYNGGILNTLEVVALIDASSDFVFAPQANPKLGPITLQPYVSVYLAHVKPGSSMDFGTSRQALSKTFGYYDTNLKISKWSDGGHYRVSFFIHPSGFLGAPHLCPIRVNGFIYYGGVGERTCAIDWEFHGQVTICLEGQNKNCEQIRFVNPGPPAQEIWVNGYPWDPDCSP